VITDTLLSTTWWRRAHPFHHVIAEDVFRPEIYSQLVVAFRSTIERAEANRELRHTTNYGADIVPLGGEHKDDFSVLLDRAWHDLLADCVAIQHSGEIDAGLHRHKVGSGSGWVHNDFNPGFFHTVARPGEALLADRSLCDYKTGRCAAPGSSAVERIRAAAMIYFLDNQWSPGCGGDTGLYSRMFQDVARPDVRIPPRNNSMLVFECTPHSYHSYLTNRLYTRNSIILWLHRSREAGLDKWGATGVVRW
jgi:hypothetical protein